MKSIALHDGILEQSADTYFQYRLGHSSSVQSGHNRLEYLYSYEDFEKELFSRLDKLPPDEKTTEKLLTLKERLAYNAHSAISYNRDVHLSRYLDIPYFLGYFEKAPGEIYWALIAGVEVSVSQYDGVGIERIISKLTPKVRYDYLAKLAKLQDNGHKTMFETIPSKVSLCNSILIKIWLRDSKHHSVTFGIEDYSKIGTFLIEHNAYDRAVIRDMSKAIKKFLRGYGEGLPFSEFNVIFSKNNKAGRIVVEAHGLHLAPLDIRALPNYYEMGLIPYVWLKKD